MGTGRSCRTTPFRRVFLASARTRSASGLFPDRGLRAWNRLGEVARASRATAVLKAAGAVHTVHAYDHDPRTTAWGEEAVAALCPRLGVTPGQVLKTLILVVEGAPAVGVLGVREKVDPKAVAAALGGRRAELAPPALAEKVTGYVLGGISPLGQRRLLRTVVDTGVLVHPVVLCSAGQRGLEIELDPADLVRLSAAVTAPITRG